MERDTSLLLGGGKKVQAPHLPLFLILQQWELGEMPHYCQVRVATRLPIWLLLTVVGVGMVFSSGVFFWNRAFIVGKVSITLGCFFLALWQERVGFSWGFFCLCPLLFVGCGLLHPVRAIKKAKRSLRELITMLFLESWLVCFLLSPFQDILMFVYI